MNQSNERLWLRGIAGGVTLCLILAVPALAGEAQEAVGATPQGADTQAATLRAASLEDTFAYDWLEELCDTVGARLSGTPAMEKAIGFAMSSLQQAGFDNVWQEPVAVTAWHRGTEWARVVAPVTFDLPVIGLGPSVPTPPDGIEAEVIVLSSFAELEARADQVKGKIVLFDPEWRGYGETVVYRSRGASEAARFGGVAALVRSMTDTSLATLHTGMMRYQEKVPPIPTAAVTIEDAGRIQRLFQRGSTVKVKLVMQDQPLPDKQEANLVADLKGWEHPQEIVLLGAHLDSWDVGTGAHDDGAGCAITLAAVRLIHQLGLRPRRTIRLVLFACEEFGGLGGKAYFERHKDELEHYVAALESDSGAFAPDGFSVRATPEVVERISRLAAGLEPLGASQVRQGWAGVDIGPMVEAGVPGIGHRVAHEHYFDVHHSAADTFDKIDPDDLAANVAAVAGLVWEIADAPASLRAH